MKKYLVPTSVLLLVGTVLGQSCPSTISPADSDPSGGATHVAGRNVQIAQQNGPAQGDQQMPGMQMPTAERDQTATKAGTTYTLEKLQQLAVDHNPTLKQAQAEIRATEARKKQAGLYPNPAVGYIGEQITGGPQRGGEQGAFFQQDIVLGGKLRAARQVVEQERLQAEAERGEQLLRVQNAVAIAYYQSLASQQTVSIRESLLKLAQDAVTTARQLSNIGQADQPDMLQAEVEAGQEEIALESAKQRQQMLWRSLAAVVGQPTLASGQLGGSLESPPDLDMQWLENTLRNSPAVKIAGLSLARAQAELDRAKREPIPDLQVRAGIQQNRELLETTGRPVGLQGLAEVGVRIPLFNRNQGNIQAAKADIERANLEQQRVQLLLQERSSPIFQNYLTAKAAVERYKTKMIPQAEKAYRLYLDRYRNMGAAYPQVLIAQRTLFQLQTDYIASLETLWVSTVTLKGFLLSDGLEAPTPPTEVDRPVRETNLPVGGISTQAK